jgi:ferrous iron transport protein B
MTFEKIALIGNPNSGKTTFFNLLTGAKQRTGNWPGVTIDQLCYQHLVLLQSHHLDNQPLIL